MKDEDMTHQLIFTTDRGEWHQMCAMEAAPEQIHVQVLRNPDQDTLKSVIAEADFWISERSGKISAEILDHAPQLKLIQRLGSLYYDIDHKAAQKAGIAVCYLPIRGVILVAEHVILQMLAIAKKVREAEKLTLEANPAWGEGQLTDEDTFHYNWADLKGSRQLWEKTVGIIGFGEIGAELARRLQGWGCQIMYHKRSRLPEWVEDQLGIQYRLPEEIFPAADYLVNLLPYLPSTKHYFQAGILEQFKNGAILVSAGSGGTIDEHALVDAIVKGKLAGAALDTFTYEPLPGDSPLCKAARAGANLLLTPHIAAGTPNWQGQIPDRSGDYRNILHFLNNEPLEYQIA